MITVFIALQLLAPASPPTAAALIARLPACESLEACPATQELVQRGAAAVPALAKAATSDPKELVRFWAFGILSVVGGEAVFEPAVKGLKDPKIRVHGAALYTLGSLKDRKGTPYLVAALSEQDVNLRIAAAIGLGMMLDPTSGEALLKAVSDRDDEVRIYALEALANLGEKRAVPLAMVRAEQDVKAKVRAAACLALGLLGDRKALSVLEKVAKGDKEPVVSAAKAALLRLRSRR